MKDSSFLIVKAFAIIFMVMGHATCPSWLCSFFSMFHIPIFFICSGYFFKSANLDNGKKFLHRRFEGLYKPFIVWSVTFLCLHNAFGYYGIISGSGSEPYTLKSFSQHLWSCLFNMSGFDNMTCGAYWFFRALFIVSISYWLLSFALSKYKRLNKSPLSPTIIAVVALGLALWKTEQGLRITGVAQGGYRELMGIYFFAIGALIKHYDTKIPINAVTALTSLTLLIMVDILGLRAALSINATSQQCLSLAITAIAGFVMIRYVAQYVVKAPKFVRQPFVYIGEHTLPIFAFHAISFKLVSLIKISVYHLPWTYEGNTMTVHYAADDWFWIFYTLVGISVPLLVRFLYHKLWDYIPTLRLSRKEISQKD